VDRSEVGGGKSAVVELEGGVCDEDREGLDIRRTA